MVAGVTLFLPTGIKASDRSKIVQGLDAGKAYVDVHLSAIQIPVCVDVRFDVDRNGGGQTSGTRVLLFTAPAGWRYAMAWHLSKVMAHEYGHLWQRATRGNSSPEPNWLIEGVAEYIGYRALIEARVVGENELRGFAQSNAEHESATLRSFEPRPPAAPQANYGLVYLALEYLLEDRGPASLQAFYVGLAQGKAWQEAFQSAFGLSSDSFYDRFESHREHGFR
jgi:hypothetical protein